MSEPFIAEIKIFAGNFAPRGWAFCNGQLLPIAQNTALFSLIGTTYGGDGRTTTGLPNLQGRAPMHPGRGPGLTPRSLGQRAGVTQVTLSPNQLANHNHSLNAVSAATSASPSAGVRLGNATIYNGAVGTPDVDMANEAVEPTGGGQPHENRQPLLGLNFLIALTGIYPPRS
jgi:microcystin-dependent protein